MAFVHLHVHSCFSMLDGAAAPEDLCRRARELGMSALALTDHNGLYGAVRFAEAARRHGIQPIFGTELTLTDDTHLVLLARDDEGWRNLCRILTRAHLESPLHHPRGRLETVVEHQEGLFVLTGCRKGPLARALREEGFSEALRLGERLRDRFGRERLFVELQCFGEERHERALLWKLATIAEQLGLRSVATNNVHQLTAADHRTQDVLSCIRLLERTGGSHPDRYPSGARYLKSESEMRRALSPYPEALANTLYLAEWCEVHLEPAGWRLPRFAPDVEEGLRRGAACCAPALPASDPVGRGKQRPYEVPGDPVGRGEPGRGKPRPYTDLDAPFDSLAHLRRLTLEGLDRRLGAHTTPRYIQRRREELDLIEEMGFADYFLICHDIVREARARGIRATGRGSAGDSLVAYSLDLVAPDPLEHDMLFQRFMNRTRPELPDIDLDFCSRRRDEVLAYVYERYGEDHVAAVATLNTFRARSAVREVAKAMGFLPEEIDDVARVFPFLSTRDIGGSLERAPEIGRCRVSLDAVREVAAIAERIAGFPRHLGIHVGGIVITDRPITDYVPLQQSAKGIVICQYDKDDVEKLGLVKLDLLALRIHSAIEHSLDLVERHSGARPDIDGISLADEATYRTLHQARTVGCFQLESPGERSLQRRLLPSRFSDVIANISLFRPGPVQGDMITPFVERRRGRQPIHLLHPKLEPILRETYGVIIYQEQVIRTIHALTGLSLDEADAFRRAMTRNNTPEAFAEIERRFLEGARQRGLTEEEARQIFGQVSAFAAYGFCKGHAACFGLIAYQTTWLKTHHPAEFLAGVLSNEPMGYYSSRTILEEAKRCGIEVRPIDVNASEAQFTTEGRSIRIGLMQLAGLAERDQEAVVRGRASGPYESVLDFCGRAALPADSLANLALAGAFDRLPAFEEEPAPEWVSFSGGITPAHPSALVRLDALRHRRRLLWLLPFLRESAEHPIFLSDLARRDREIRRRLDEEESITIPRLERELLLLDHDLLHLSALRHPMCFARPRLEREGRISSTGLEEAETGSWVRTSGVVVSRNRPPTKSGRIVVFVTLEDEVGLFDAVLFEQAYLRLREVVFGHDTLRVEGRVERHGGGAPAVLIETASPLEAVELPGGPSLTPGPGDHSSAGPRGRVA